MYILAYVSLLAALLAAIGGGGLALLQLWEGRDNLGRKLELGAWIIAGALLLASAILLHALFWRDYRLEYAASYTDAWLPAFYRLTAFWAGQPGSMLFWAVATAVFGVAFAFPLRRQPSRVRLWHWVFFYLIMAFFCLILTAWSNPFILQEPVPADGAGLNPLLQNPGMIIHPPLLFMGYAGLTIPACLGLAQLISAGMSCEPWQAVCRPFYLLAWLFLSAGIIIGGWWAYMELGWGGYWAWDPVENASLLPWLISTAAMHAIAVTRRFDRLNRYGAALMAIALLSAFFATYLTRSGVIQSVHAFGDGGVGTPLAVFTLGGAAIVAAILWAAPGKPAQLADLFGREGAILLASWILLALALIIALATMWPVLSRLWGAAAQGLEASFYNRVCLPLFSLLLLLLAFCQYLKWQGGLAAGHRLYIACGVGLCAFFGIWWGGFHKPLPLVAAALACVIIIGAILAAARKPAWRKPVYLGALGAHLGVGMIALGIAFSGPYTIERDLLLARGQTENAGVYSVELRDVREGRGPGYDYLQATLDIALNGAAVGVLRPERRIYEKFGDMQFSEVDVLNGLGRDIYASLLGMDEDHKVLVRISLEPLINWIWIGGALLCLLPLAGLRRGKKAAPPAA